MTRDRFRVARVYDHPAGEGHRVLVDRLWPRGLTREAADVEAWVKDVAPSNDLRRWYAHEADKYAEFADRYRAELDGDAQRAGLSTLRALTGVATLLTSTREVELSHATVLAETLNGQPNNGPDGQQKHRPDDPPRSDR